MELLHFIRTDTEEIFLLNFAKSNLDIVGKSHSKSHVSLKLEVPGVVPKTDDDGSFKF